MRVSGTLYICFSSASSSRSALYCAAVRSRLWRPTISMPSAHESSEVRPSHIERPQW